MPSPKNLAVQPPFEIVAPATQQVPLVFNSPHSGRCYPEAFLAASRLDERAIRRSEDTFVDELFLPAVALGAPLLRANFPRAWLDVNREPYELDPRLFEGALPPYANARSTRVAGGLGTIPRIVAENEEIYHGPLPVAEALARIEGAYRPYHAALAGLISQTRTGFGCAVLVDCHSMPSNARGAHAPDIVLGDRFGASCHPSVTALAEATLRRLGYRVARNAPFAGGHTTQTYGRPTLRAHALQIEINRALYLDERTLERTNGFARVRADMSRLAEALAAAALHKSLA